jgi:hypothetical protein
MALVLRHAPSTPLTLRQLPGRCIGGLPGSSYITGPCGFSFIVRLPDTLVCSPPLMAKVFPYRNSVSLEKNEWSWMILCRIRCSCIGYNGYDS